MTVNCTVLGVGNRYSSPDPTGGFQRPRGPGILGGCENICIGGVEGGVFSAVGEVPIRVGSPEGGSHDSGCSQPMENTLVWEPPST
jgi:hypothetical protein